MEHLLSFPWDELLGGWTSSLEGGVFLRLLLHDAKMQFQEPCQVHVCENVHLLPQSPASGIVLFNLAVHQRSQFYSHLRKPLAAKLRFYPRRSQPCSRVLEQWEAMRFTAAVTRGSTWSIAGSVVQSLSRAWLWGSVVCSTPGFPVLHYLPGFAQAHVHSVDDAIQPSHPLLSPPSPPAQHQGLLQ